MAHLSDDRGQLILVAGFALAVTFVTLALVLNAAIYTGNLATRGENAVATDALQFRESVETDVGELIRYTNREASNSTDSHDQLESDVTGAVENISHLRAYQTAQVGRVVNASVTRYEPGTWIFQNDTTDYSNATGDANWTLASDVNRTRAFRMNVTRLGSLAGTEDDAFTLRINDTSNSSREWNMSVYRPAPNDITVTVDNGSDLTTCTESGVGVPVRIDVTGGTVAGQYCDRFDFANNLDSAYTINYTRGNKIEGNYSLVVTNASIDRQSPPSNYVGGSPYAENATYSVTLETVYESPRLYYRTDVRVAPGETDD